MTGISKLLSRVVPLERLGTSRFPDDAARDLRRERLALALGNTRTIALCNVLYALVTAWWFWGRGIDMQLAVWAGAMTLLNAYAIWRSVTRDPSRPHSGSVGATRAHVRQTVLLAFLYGVAPFFLLPVATGSDVAMIAGMTAGSLVVGPYVVYAIPEAALAWLGVSTVLNAVSFMGTGEGGLVIFALFAIGMAAGVSRACIKQSIRLTDQWEIRRSLSEKNDVIDLLLKEYEDSSDAWIWECDAMGTLTRLPRPLLAMREGTDGLGRGERTIQSLLARGGSRRGAMIAERFSDYLKRREAFHDLEIPMRDVSTGKLRWLRVRGTPRQRAGGRFKGFRGIVNDVTEAKAADERIRFLASHDALTSLPNRTTFANGVRPWAKAGRPFASLHFDLDKFKLVNDTFGHVAGDELLVQVARRIEAAVSAAHGEALCARVGGDEFMAAMPLEPCSAGDAMDDRPVRELAATIVRELGVPFTLTQGTVTIGCSVGFGLWPDDAPDLADLPARVDLALYRAKSEGRGRFARYEEGMDRRARERKLLEAALREALRRGEIRIAFQPVVDLTTGRVTGAEALARWTHSELGEIKPDAFIPLAEESGLIVPIGGWVIEQACREAASWETPITLSVNVSARQLSDDGFIPLIERALAQSGLPASRLEVEMTETVLQLDPEGTLEAVSALRALGVGIVLDDFGTGYSSLGYLGGSSFDKIKVDRAFVAKLDEGGTADNANSAALVRALVTVAQCMGMETTAEGIETEAQAEALRELGCHSGQGYLLIRPLPSEEIDALASLLRSHPAQNAASVA